MAGAQTDELKGKPPQFRYVSYWTFPRAHWADVDKDNATDSQKILAPALADSPIVAYEIDREMIHTTDSRAQLHFSFVMPSAEGLDRFNATLGAAIDANSLIRPAFGSMMVNLTP